MEPNHGIYQAMVTDNSTFYSTGKIRVRVQNMHNTTMNWDLSQDFNANKFNKNRYEDIDALVYTPIGGGSGHGLFSLPQINSVGIVQYMNGNVTKPIWMGSFFNPIYDDKGKVLKVNVPNDNPDMEGNGSDGITKGPNDSIAQKRTIGPDGSIIWRTKTTSEPGENNDPKNMDFNEQRSENLIVFNKDKINFTHFSKWDSSGDTPQLKQWEEIELGTHKEYASDMETVVNEFPELNIRVSEVKSGNKLKTLSVVINNDKVSLEVIDGDVVTNLGINSEGVEIISSNSKSKSSTSFEQTPEKITLAGKNTSVTVEQNEVILHSEQKIRISAKKLILGNNGGRLMGVNNMGGPIETRDGYTMFSTNIEV